MRRIADHWWRVGAVVLVGVLAVSSALRGSELDRRQAQQRAAQRQAVVLLQGSVNDVLGRERALGRVIGTLDGHLAGRWPALASIVTSQSVANSVGFIEPVTQRDLPAFEHRTGLRPFDSPTVGIVHAAAHRAVHLVVTHAFQNDGGVALLGLDLAANPLRRTLLLQSARTGRPVATPPVEFLSPPAHRHGVIVYAAVRDARGALLGWVTAAYEARRLAAMVTAHAPGTRLTIHDGSTVLVSAPGPLAGPPATINVAGRRWTVWATARANGISGLPWLVLACGFCLAAAASLILRQTSTRARDAARTLSQRDADEAALREIATLVAENAAPDAVFASVAEQIRALFDARTAAVSRFDIAGNRGIVVGGWTSEGQNLAGSEFALDGVTASAEVFRSHGSVARTELAYQSQTDPIAPLMSTLSASGGIAAPIFVAGELWGALGAAYSDRPIPPGAELRLERFARLVGLTISNTEAWDRLARQASTDPLTGLANRRAFSERLSAEIARANRHDRNLSIVLLDLDHFKRINDEHGHQAGDRALVRFAELLRAHTRDGELSARIGGEEFAWLLPETDQAGAYAAADRIRAALENEPFPDLGTLTLSAGVRSAGPSDDVDALINDADQALYRAKKSGRNMTLIYDAHTRQTLAGAHAPVAKPATPPATGSGLGDHHHEMTVIAHSPREAAIAPQPGRTSAR
jgi:diguanylate cyclase (GGDEF)-like protein